MTFRNATSEPLSTGSCDGTWQRGDGVAVGVHDLEQYSAGGITLLVTAWL